ncbi:MAG: hypothetical protein EOP86_02875 [Verrucomicrobiaceae bacterium]|nr:MAG: hypothetical protein EOP86_02875 [Verrucomicrobiaceae bacterium]
MKKSTLRLSLAACALTVSTAPAGFQTHQPAEVILGNLYAPTQALYYPMGITVDPVTKKIFVCDTGSNRILRFPAAAGLTPKLHPEAVLGQENMIDRSSGTTKHHLDSPRAVVFDAAGHLWVSDSANNRVLRYDNPSVGETPAPNGVLGRPDFVTSQHGLGAAGMWKPSSMACSGTTLYVVDESNKRVLRFDNAAAKANGAPAQAVFGQADFNSGVSGLTAKNFSSPGGVALTTEGGSTTLWVSDVDNARVLGFPNPNAGGPAGATATRVLGQADFTSKANNGFVGAGTLFWPGQLTASGGSLYLADTGFFRVLRWDSPGSGQNNQLAAMVYGQRDFSSGKAATATGAENVRGVFVDGDGALWVTDIQKNRVVRYDHAPQKPMDSDFDFVLSPEGNDIQDPPSFGSGLAIDPASGKVYVSDAPKNRVLRFSSYAVLVAGYRPEAVFGQADFEGKDAGLWSTEMNAPTALACDSNDQLWVADTGNNRVLRFTNASSQSNGPVSKTLLGQLAYGLGGSSAGAGRMNAPRGLAVDGQGTLWVADSGNNRLLRFNLALLKNNGAVPDGYQGQATATASAPGLTSRNLNFPTGLAMNAGRLWVLDGGNNRVLRFDSIAGRANFAAADGVLGQPGFTTKTAGSGAAEMSVGEGSLVVDSFGRLYVSERDNRRITWFNAAAGKTNGGMANGVLGRSGFGATDDSWDNLHVGKVTGIAMDPRGSLWAADSLRNRVLRFSPVTPAVTACEMGANNHFNMTFKSTTGAFYQAERSADLKTWTPSGAKVQAIGEIAVWSDPALASGKQFYRLREVAP